MNIGIGVVLLTILLATHAYASVDRIEVQSREPFYASKNRTFTKIVGTFIGSLTPDEAIPGLDKAIRRADGRVEYRSDFIILAPDFSANSNRVLLFDVENNGSPVVHGMYNSPFGSLAVDLEIGNGFVEERGYTVVIVSWQDGHGIELPQYTAGQDGDPALLAAVGFAALRDFAYFLRFQDTDTVGNVNPVASTVDFAIAAGSSQTARLLKSFVFHGFNNVQGQTVFNGLHLRVGQVGTMPFIPPADADPDVVRRTLVGDSAVYPYTFAEMLEPLAEQDETPPKILALNVEGDYLRRRQSLLLTGPSGTTITALPESVVIWDVAGGSHGIRYESGCDMPRGNLDWHPLLRAGLVELTRWVVDGELPPPTRLMELEITELAPYIASPPADLPNARMLVPRRDADNLGLGGVRLPPVSVPLGTFGGWNAPLESNCGDQSNFWHAFPRTRLHALMTRDSRRSLEERYDSADEYLQRFAAAARELVSDGYLLEEDAKAFVAEASKARRVFSEPSRH